MARKKDLWTAASIEAQATTLADAIREEFKVRVDGPVDIGIDSIVKERDTQVRDGGGEKIDKNLVAQYASHIRAGTALPPCIINDLQQGIDLNTRRAAALEAGQATLPVLIVYTGGKHAMDRMIGAWANQRGGARLTDREAAKEARDMAENGVPAALIARRLGYSGQKVNKIVRVVEVEARAKELGIELNGLPDNVKERLQPLKMDVALTEAVKLATDAHLKPAQVGAVVKALDAVGTEEASREVAARARVEHAERIEMVAAGMLTPKPSPWTSVKMHIGGLVKIDTNLLPSIADADERASTVARINEAVAVLQAAAARAS